MQLQHQIRSDQYIQECPKMPDMFCCQRSHGWQPGTSEAQMLAGRRHQAASLVPTSPLTMSSLQRLRGGWRGLCCAGVGSCSCRPSMFSCGVGALQVTMSHLFVCTVRSKVNRRVASQTAALPEGHEVGTLQLSLSHRSANDHHCIRCHIPSVCSRVPVLSAQSKRCVHASAIHSCNAF